MQLYSNGMSPYGRKVMVVIRELGLLDRVELVESQPRLNPEGVIPVNPVGKIPVLVLEDGTTLRDSPVIAQYLCDTFGGSALLPRGPRRWRALTEVADADTVIESGILVRNERLRPAERQSEEFIDWNLAKAVRAMAAFEADARSIGSRWDLGTIAIGCAIGYLQRRLPEFEGLLRYPALAALYPTLSERPAFAATEPA
ncbi:MAG: glutathione S-transferase N-terminal domain-containing protein [Rhizobiaceae bacterium]